MATTPKPKPEIVRTALKYDIAGIEKKAYTVLEFCSAFRLSKSMFYKIRAAGHGPKESHAGSKVLISYDAADAWLKACEKTGTN
jgi:hypothetical protein